MTNGEHGPMRLRRVFTADFRKTEATLLAEAQAEVENLRLGRDDCILFISHNGKIMRFVFGFLEHDMVNASGKVVAGKQTKVLPSKTYRITEGGTFNPHMLANYAQELGLELAHLKKFDAHLKRELAERT